MVQYIKFYELRRMDIKGDSAQVERFHKNSNSETSTIRMIIYLSENIELTFILQYLQKGCLLNKYDIKSNKLEYFLTYWKKGNKL